jgi:acetyl esterase/lipase
VDELRGPPKALVFTAECDSLWEDGERYARMLREAGVEAVYERFS